MTTRQRALWIAATAAVGWSGWVLMQPAATDDSVVRAAPRSSTTTARATTGKGRAGPSADDVCVDVNLPVRTQLAEQSAANPFQRPVPKVAPVQVQVVPVHAAPPPPPPPPPPRPTLPYRYLGMLAERDGSDARVFLMMGDKLIMARVGDVVEGGFRLDHIAARELRFVRPSDNLTLKLSVEEGIAS